MRSDPKFARALYTATLLVGLAAIVAFAATEPATSTVPERRGMIAHQIPIATGQYYAPGTKQNHPAQPALDRKIPGVGEYWFRLFQKPYWHTTRLKNGRYLLVVRAWDAAGNRARSDIEIGIRNPPL